MYRILMSTLYVLQGTGSGLNVPYTDVYALHTTRNRVRAQCTGILMYTLYLLEGTGYGLNVPYTDVYALLTTRYRVRAHGHGGLNFKVSGIVRSTEYFPVYSCFHCL
jgi:hypothetical protein